MERFKTSNVAGKAFGLRRAALLGASAAAMVAAFGSTASAQSNSSYDLDLTLPFVWHVNPFVVQVDYNIMVTPDQFLVAPSVGAVIDDTFVGASLQPGTGFVGVVSDDSLSATAKGNFASAITDRVVDLALLSAGVAPVDGIGILTSQFVAGSAITAEISNSVDALLLTDFLTGTGEVSRNTAIAITTGNEISPEFQVRGQLPIAYTSSQTASTVGLFDGNVGTLAIDSAASVAIMSVQVGIDSGAGASSVASLNNVDVFLTVDDTADATTTATLSVDDNQLQAQYTGNSARNVFLAEAGGNPVFVGSVVVSSSQANIETTAPAATDYAAFVTNSSISATVGDGVVDGVSSLTLGSVLDVSGNTISAAARGNVAQSVGLSGQPVVGNAIVFDPGISIVGNAVSGSNVINIPSSDILSANLAGDLVLYNGQGNQGTAIAALVGANTITATVEQVVDGGINLSDNSVDASATGNSAIGLIQVGEAASIDAIVAAANLQTNDATPINAQNNGTQIVATVGQATAGAPAPVTGTFTINNNAVTATATGNRSGDPSLPTISLNAVTLNSLGDLALVTSDSLEYGALTTVGGITASNLQNNYGEAIGITATVSDAIIHARLYNPNAVNLENGSTLTVNDNVFAAAAASNVGNTGISLQGTDGAFSAASSSSQYNVNIVSAVLWNDSVFALMDDALDSTVTLDGNVFSASATGNRATTTLSVTGFTSLTLGGAAAWAIPSVESPDVPGAVDTTATGGLVSLNSQTNEGSVTSLATSNSGTPFVSLSLNDVREDGTASVSDNSVAASAIGNQGTTSLTLDVTDLATASGNADQIATVSSRQIEQGLLVQSSVERTGGTGAIGMVASGDLIDATVTVNDNSLSSFTAANFASNSLLFTGTSYGSTAVAGSEATLTYFAGGGTDFETSAEFALQNVQQASNADATYAASVTGAAVGVALTGTVNGDILINSVVTVSGNTASADARGNYASNSVPLTGFSALSTSAGLHNVQSVLGDVTATVLEFETGIEADLYGVDGGTLTVSNNAGLARAIGNTAFNDLTVDATVLGGNGGDGLITKDTLAVYAPYSANADYAVASWQGMTGSVSATATGMALIDLSDFGNAGLDNIVDSAVLTMANNSLTAIAQSNSVANTLALTTNNSPGVTAALLSEQRAGDGGAAIGATANAGAGSDFVTAGIVTEFLINSPIAVTGNSVTAIAGNNVATNTLTVDVTADLVGGSTLPTPNGTLAGATFQAQADFALFNVQDAIGSTVSATATPGLIGVLITDTATDSPISVSNNNVAAQATMNTATNTVSLTGAAGLSASAALVNSQSTDPGDFTASATATVQFGAIGATVANGVSGSPLNASSNSFSASAAGNVATNALNATASSVYGVGGGPTIGGAIAGGFTSQADYTILNSQSNNATITASASTLGIGLLSAGPVTGSNMTVQNNTISASATANRATNSIGMSSVAGSMPSASLTSSQFNTASVSASVTGAAIGIGAGGVSGSNGIVSNNSISATAIGNSTRNTIGIGN